MSINELRQLSANELKLRLSSSIMEYKKVKLKLKQGDLSSENINNARKLKKEIARIKTILRELEIFESLK